MRGHFLILTLVALTGPAGALRAAPVTYREQSDLTREASGIATVTIEDARGQVTARPSTDGRIHVKALKVVRGPSMEDARRVAAETVVEVDEAGGRLAIRVRYPHLNLRLNLWQHGWGDVVPSDEVRLSVELPAALGFEARTASGDLSSQGLSGSQRFASASGDVSVASAGGPLVVSTASGDVTLSDASAARVGTASGDIEVEGARGALDLQSASGDVTVSGAVDSVRARTASGSLRVDGAPLGADLGSTSGEVRLGPSAGHVRARTVSGDLDVRLRGPLRGAELATQSGGLTVTLAPDLACTLDAVSVSGSIDLEGVSQVTRQSRNRVTAGIRGGGAPVGLRTVSGDIRVVVGGGK